MNKELVKLEKEIIDYKKKAQLEFEKLRHKNKIKELEMEKQNWDVSHEQRMSEIRLKNASIMRTRGLR